jgi:uncharacterized SAM-binding protein YcdF (DUF218 family)
MPDYDAVIVPGGGVRAGGALPPWVESRFEKALAIAGGAPIIALSAGTPHRPPPLDAGGRPILESVAGIEYLLRRGYSRERLLAETASYDTVGNAYFCRAIHTDPANLRRLAVVTSEFHMPRTEAVFRWVFGALPSEAYRLTFVATPDTGMPAALRDSRAVRERSSLQKLQALTRQCRTLAAIHGWLFREHDAYAAGQPRGRQAAEGILLESY